MVRIVASDVIGTQRRQILDERVNRMSASYQDKLDFVREASSEFLYDIFSDIEGNFEYEISIGDVIGFETKKDFYNGKGYIRSFAVLKTPSSRKLYMDLNVPLYRGSLYKPSIVSINSNIIVFSSAAIDNFVNSTLSVRPKMYNQYLPERKTYRSQVVHDSIFDLPEDDFYSEDGPVLDHNY